MSGWWWMPGAVAIDELLAVQRTGWSCAATCVTTDELLGLKATRRPAAPAKISPRLERRLRQIERLDPKPKQQILATLDTLLTAEAIKQQAGR